MKNFGAKVVNFVSKNFFCLACAAFYGIFAIIVFLQIKPKFLELDNPRLCQLAFCIIVLVLFVLIMFITKKIKDCPHEKKFAVVALLFGVIFLIISPLFTGSDEHNHYYRIYEITDGVFFTPTSSGFSGGELPSSLKETFIVGSGDNTKIKYSSLSEMVKVDLNEEINEQYGINYATSYSNTSLYSPVSYFPHVIGFLIGRILKCSPYAIGILGRVFNLIIYVIIGYYALKVAPKGKLFYLLILISPNMLQCATTLSADAFINVVFLLFLSILMNIHFSKDKIKKRQKIILTIVAIILSLCKLCYFPIVFAVLLIGKDRYKNGMREKMIFCIPLILFCCTVSALWTLSTGNIFAVAYPAATLQKDFILQNPIRYFAIFCYALSAHFMTSIECLFVGTTMYHAQLAIPSLISITYVVVVMLALLCDGGSRKMIHDKQTKFVISLIALVIIGLILTALYVQCTAQFVAVGNKDIIGIQGRYFIPVVFLIPIFLSLKKPLKIDPNKLITISMVIVAIVQLFAICQFTG